jgi:hypothetical protein
MNKKTLVISALLALIGVLSFSVAPVLAMEGDCEAIPATIDIKPGEFPNPINLKSNGVIPVALLGSATFNVANVALDSIGLHPMGPCDEAVAPVKFAFEDVNKDGFKDIVFKFKTADITLTSADTVACLHGDIGGVHFCGHDEVVVRG